MARSRDENKTDSIYEATLALIMDTGYAELNMAQVARRAGIATGTIYTYFKNKEELVNKLFIHLKEEKVKKMFVQFNEADSFFLTFRKLWTAYFDLSFSEPHKMLFIEQYTYSPLLSAQSRQRSDALLEPLVKLLEQAQKDDLIKEVSPILMLNYVMGAVLEIAKYCHSTGYRLSEADREACFQMAWSAIRK
jgi:AcrR family transcriptional regulator